MCKCPDNRMMDPVTPDTVVRDSIATPVRGAAARHGRLRRGDAHLTDLLDVVAEGVASTDLAAYPHADRLEQGVLVYSATRLRDAPAATRIGDAGSGEESGSQGSELEAELARALSDGPGIIVIGGAFERAVVDTVTEVFDAIIAEQRASGHAQGDHFGRPGANDRVWNGLEKVAVRAPDAFVAYCANEIVDLVARAWLGPGYQMTWQPNVVNPGGAGQTVHRDYHLGFMDPDRTERYPAHVHALSPMLTLQGAVAHVDMPVESGPTLYLPHSQKYSHGYLAYWLKDFQDHFVANHVQLPLRLGDAVFFNPALMHAAGTNQTTDVRRMANLLQVSSAMGRAMESVDRARVVRHVYPALLAAAEAGMPPARLAAALACAAEGYPFPTNLERDEPVEGMAPPSQSEIVAAALARRAPLDEVVGLLDAQSTRTRTH